MPKYLIEASYAPEGAQGVLTEGGSSRRDTIQKLTQDLGGTMESFYFGFGEHDAYVTVDLPDNATAAAIALAVNSNRAARAKTVVLLTPEEVDKATKKTVNYRPPGR
jgi:uncharacterized protein with GYD domain